MYAFVAVDLAKVRLLAGPRSVQGQPLYVIHRAAAFLFCCRCGRCCKPSGGDVMLCRLAMRCRADLRALQSPIYPRADVPFTMTPSAGPISDEAVRTPASRWVCQITTYLQRPNRQHAALLPLHGDPAGSAQLFFVEAAPDYGMRRICRTNRFRSAYGAHSRPDSDDVFSSMDMSSGHQVISSPTWYAAPSAPASPLHNAPNSFRRAAFAGRKTSSSAVIRHSKLPFIERSATAGPCGMNASI